MERSTTPVPGGCIFAECPDTSAPDARLLWTAEFDPATLRVVAELAGAADDPEVIDPAQLAPWLTLVEASTGQQYGVISDGWHHIRFDVEGARFTSGQPLLLHFVLSGQRGASRRLMPLKRFLHFCRHRAFPGPLYPIDARTNRALEVLRVHDALAAGASQREIAEIMFGREMLDIGWNGHSDFLRSKVRRLVRQARRLAQGGFRTLMTRD